MGMAAFVSYLASRLQLLPLLIITPSTAAAHLPHNGSEVGWVAPRQQQLAAQHRQQPPRRQQRAKQQQQAPPAPPSPSAAAGGAPALRPRRLDGARTRLLLWLRLRLRLRLLRCGLGFGRPARRVYGTRQQQALLSEGAGARQRWCDTVHGVCGGVMPYIGGCSRLPYVSRHASAHACRRFRGPSRQAYTHHISLAHL